MFLNKLAWCLQAEKLNKAPCLFDTQDKQIFISSTLKYYSIK